MNTVTTIPLIGPGHAGRIFSAGWQNAVGGKTTVTDKATGEVLFESGLANAADVAAAAKSARLAQPAWAATPGPLRADVIRKFASLVEANADEITTWIVRETGSIPPTSLGMVWVWWSLRP